jgi:hypothetical protein
MKCPICLSRMQSDTEDCLADHLVDVHGYGLFDAGRVAQRISNWRAYEAILARDERVGQRGGDALVACA